MKINIHDHELVLFFFYNFGFHSYLYSCFIETDLKD